jgi:hypothetical protein
MGINMKSFEQIKKNKKQDVINMCIDALVSGKDKDIALMHAIKCLQTAAITPKNDIEWVGLAKAKQDVRFFLKYIHSDGCDLVASDGYRMHILKGVGIDKGYYESEQFAVKYPDHKKLLDLPWQLVGGGVEYEWLEHKRVCKIGGLYFDANYINDAISLMGGEIVTYVCDKNLRIECGDMIAIVCAVHT